MMASDIEMYTCNTCSCTFNCSELQRSHMRAPWHIYNLKQRMIKMPALTLEQFDALAQPDEFPNPKTSKEDDMRAAPESRSESGEENQVDKRISPSECLFCNIDSFNVEDNVEHMRFAHGLYIPEADQLSDMETFIGYLALIICEYNECLYCGVEKTSLEAIQTHMKDKGHCMINLDGESELLDFWDVSGDEDNEEPKGGEKERSNDNRFHISATEMRLPSGSIITSRSDTAQLRAKPTLTKSRVKASQTRINKDRVKAITNGTEDKLQGPDGNRSMRTQPGTDHRMAIRGEMGLIGLPEQQRRALMATEIKMKKREHIAKAAQRWATEKVANKQKFFKPDVPGRKNG
ncbi:C2H2 type zinc-finger-domain-containing protein [Bipolaris maydis]|nr:C2H2 type zinc-finger-domain-containing protein [Bipolaris maydis]KAJ6265094.1 C2H2 type zinc-finger-domain-containing protein [Bipolaris maydis]